MRPLPVVIIVACALIVGCGGSNAPLEAPDYDPDGMAKAAMKQYDANGNGTLDATEVDACPGLKAALATFDANNDKAVSLDELAERFRAYEKAGVGVMSVTCTVQLNKKPLEGATVTFTPGEFMQGKVKGATGRSDATGQVSLSGDDGLPGLAAGVYRVTVSRKGTDGNEQIPDKYNAKTTLGFEVGPGGRGSPAANFNLTTK